MIDSSIGEVDWQQMYASVINEALWQDEVKTDTLHSNNGTDRLRLDKYNDKSGTTTQQQSDSIPAQYFYALQGLSAITQGLDDSMAWRRSTQYLYPRDFSATTQGLNNSMACGRSDGATIRADILDTIQKFRHRGPDDTMNVTMTRC